MIGAIWVTTEESIANEFSEYSRFGSKPKKFKDITYTGIVKKDINLLDLDTEEICNDKGFVMESGETKKCITPEEFSTEIDEDSNAVYDYIDNKKYDGAYRTSVTPDSNAEYEDYALFQKGLDKIKFDKVIINNKELPFEKAEKEFDGFCKQKLITSYMKGKKNER